MGSARHCRSCGAFVDRNPEHPCPFYREEPPLPEADPSFNVIPQRTPAQLAESLRRYRRALRD
jgi:hypothetical protein